MKKTLLGILAALLCFCMVIPAFADDPADTKGSVVEYTVTGGYEWSVPAKTTFTGVNTNQTLAGPVEVTKCLLEDKNYLTIRIGDDENVNDFKLKNEKNAEVTLNYEIAKYAGNWVPLQNKDLVLRICAGEPANTDGTLVTPVQQKLYGKIVEIPKVAGKYTDTITFVASCDTLPPDDLTDWTWVGNDTIDVSSLRSILGSPYSVEVNFKCQTHNCIAFRVDGNSLIWKTGTAERDKFTVYTGTWKTGGDWKSITFTEDVTDSHKEAFINWLNENGTFLSGPGEGINLTGYKWIGNQTLDIKSHLDSLGVNSINYDVDFTCHLNDSFNDCIAFRLLKDDVGYRIFVKNKEGQNYETHLYEKGNYYLNKSATDYAIIFTGGADVTNPDLIAWLQANGTLEKVN